MMIATTQLLILGNGFDLHCGLKSSYKSFFETAILDTYKEHFGITQTKADVSGFWEGLLLEYYRVYKNKQYNWCDIESIIQQTVFDIKSRLWDAVMTFNARNPVSYDEFVSGTIEKYIVAYCCRLFYSGQQKIEQVLNNILQELHNFEKRFCKYIKGTIIDSHGKGLNTQYILNATNLIAKLTGFTSKHFDDLDSFIMQGEKEVTKYLSAYQRVTSREKANFLTTEFLNLKSTYILSFNYTALFDILAVDSPCSYNNVHGKLCQKMCEKDCETSNIIFGIDDSLIQAKPENSELRIFSKTYRKMLDMVSPTNILPLNNTPVIIKFYGHSLSQADYSYFQSIFDYYNLYGNHKVSLIFYYSEGYEQTDTIYSLINAYGQSLDNKDQGKNLIHKLLLENRLKIQKI